MTDTATWTLGCDYCPDPTADPIWCDHGRVTCASCRDHRLCRDCLREARP